MKRDGIVFYRSFMDAIGNLEPVSYKNLVSAILHYGMDGEEPSLTGVEQSLFCLIKPQIDANNKRYENGKKGGRPKTETKPNDNQSKTKVKPKEKDKDKEKDKEYKREKVVSFPQRDYDYSALEKKLLGD